MTEAILYHNPRCSKSRGALELLQENGVEPRIVRYLETPPDLATLRELLGKLGMAPRELLRRSEDEYRELNLADPALDDEAILKAMVEHPKLIERPILVVGARAVVGRPPERVLELIR